MLKKLRKPNIILHIIYAIVVLMLVESVVLSKYMYSVTASSALDAGVMITDVIDISSAVKEMKPGDSREIIFKVSNTKDGVVSDLKQTYSIKLISSGTLPLSYSVYCSDNFNGIGSEDAPVSLTPNVSTEEKAVLHSKEHETHTYVLNISWNFSDNDDAYSADYSNLLDYTYIQINSEQSQTTKNSK